RAGEPLKRSTGTARRRWATHRAPTTPNSDPYVDCSGRIAFVHNGIIENADVLRAALQACGHRFCTETDTETLAHLIEDAGGETLEARVIAALGHVVGPDGRAGGGAGHPRTGVVASPG